MIMYPNLSKQPIWFFVHNTVSPKAGYRQPPLKLKPAAPSLGHTALSIRLVIVHPSVIRECGTANNVDDDKDNEDDDDDNRYLSPTVSDAGWDSSLAQVTLKAELLLVIVPSEAIKF